MKVLMHLHPYLILHRYCYWLLQTTFSVITHSFKSRDALEPRQNAYIFSNSYLAERSSIAFLARFSDRVEES